MAPHRFLGSMPSFTLLQSCLDAIDLVQVGVLLTFACRRSHWLYLQFTSPILDPKVRSRARQLHGIPSQALLSFRQIYARRNL